MFEDRPELQQRLADEIVVWLTTVTPAGQPQPAPVWFVVADDHFVIYSRDDVPRLRNIAANPKVALNLNSDREGEELTVIHGEAEIIGREVKPSEDPAYAARYQEHLGYWDFSWETYDRGYPVRLHIRPTHVRR